MAVKLVHLLSSFLLFLDELSLSLLQEDLSVLILNLELLVRHLDEHVVVYLVRATFKLLGNPAIDLMLIV